MQILGFKWKNEDIWRPKILIKDNENKLRFLDVFDKSIFMKLGEKYCVGYFSNGKKTDCPQNTIVKKGNICDSCRDLDQYFKCIECTGTCINEKNRDNCKESTFYMYFTTFGPLLKVGISQEHRFYERMIEQGAELGIKFSRIKDGKEARVIEQEIKKLLYCEDRVYGDIKEKTVFGDPNTVILKVKEALNTLQKNGYQMINTEIYDFRKYYRLDRVKKTPLKINVDTGSVIQGDIVAAKGNIIIIKSADNFYTLNSHRLISRELLEFSLEDSSIDKNIKISEYSY